jgi:hypothetical protein
VSKIELLDDGKRAEVTYLLGKREIVNVADFRQGKIQDLIGNLDRFGLIGLELFPIMIRQQQLLLDKRGRIEHPEVFKAMCNGFVIDLSVMQDVKGRADIIDI